MTLDPHLMKLIIEFSGCVFFVSMFIELYKET